MRRPWMLLWLGTSVVGLTLLPGCKDAPQSCSSCHGGAVSSGHGAAASSGNEAVSRSSYIPRGTVTHMTGTEASKAIASPESVVIMQDKQDTAEPAPSAITLTSATEPAAARRTYADITASPAFGHAPDYTWIVGELQYLHVRNAWRVRYASVDEEDRYGGSVTLVETGSMDKYPKSGQIVRVQGQLINADSKEPSPAFRVISIRNQDAQ